MDNGFFRCLGLDADADFDRFAAAFGGISRKEALKRLGVTVK